jgi:hypothetical protein
MSEPAGTRWRKDGWKGSCEGGAGPVTALWPGPACRRVIRGSTGGRSGRPRLQGSPAEQGDGTVGAGRKAGAR